MRSKTTNPLRGPPFTLCDIIKHGFFQQIQRLIVTGISIESRDILRRTPVILCAFMEPEVWGVGVARTLIENGACLTATDSAGRNVLHYACIYEREGLIDVLLNAIDFDLNTADKLGNTALHYAGITGNQSVTLTIVEHFHKYRISFDKRNKQGKIAAEEASQAGHNACAHIIDNGNLHRRGSLNNEGHTGSGPFRNIASAQERRRKPQLIAFLTRHDSISSDSSSQGLRESASFLRSRSNSNLSIHYTRRSQSSLYRREDEIIHICADNDFRNKPDYVFKLVHLPYDPHWEMMASETARTTSWKTKSSAWSRALLSNWRREFQHLYRIYELQCSSSWRPTTKVICTSDGADQGGLSSPMNDDDEDKGKKCKRLNSAKSQDNTRELKRRQSVSRMRKTSTITSPTGHGKHSTVSLDGILDTSTESLNSQASARRRERDGRDRADNPTPRSAAKLSTESPQSGATTETTAATPSAPPEGSRITVTNNTSLKERGGSSALKRHDSASSTSSSSRKISSGTSDMVDGCNERSVPVVKIERSMSGHDTQMGTTVDVTKLAVPELYEDDDVSEEDGMTE